MTPKMPKAEPLKEGSMDLFRVRSSSRATVAVLTVAAFGLCITGAPAAASSLMQTQDVVLSTHVELGLPEQDAFVEVEEGGSEVVRPDVEDTNSVSERARKVFASAEPHEHDPFKTGDNPLGPFEKGEPLGFTLGEWLAGDGRGSYTVDGDEAQLELSLSNLVPGGLYTVWCARANMPPGKGSVDDPCGAADGSENTFTADDEGDATFSVSMTPLEPSSAETMSVIAIAYHSDGKSYGAHPGEFGQYTHVQLAWLMPPPEAGQAGDDAGDDAADDAADDAGDDADDEAGDDDAASNTDAATTTTTNDDDKAAGMPSAGAGGPFSGGMLTLAAAVLFALGLMGWWRGREIADGV